MKELRPYLLENREQLEAFEKSLGDKLDGKLRGCLTWLRRFPLEKWFDPVAGVREADARKEVIRTICALYWRKKINISFDENMWLKLHPADEEERLAWLKADGWHGPGIDK